MNRKWTQWLFSLKPWHFMVIGCISSEILTLAFSSLFIELFYPDISADRLKFTHQLGMFDAFFVAFLVIALILYMKHLFEREIRESKAETERSNAQLAIANADLEDAIKKLAIAHDAALQSEQRALNATKAKDAFLANMSHEIRTPLTAILGFAEYSLDKDLPNAERMSSLRTIVSSGNHLLNIINDILDFSKIEADSIEIEHLDINPVQLAAEVQSLVMPLAGKRKLFIRLEYQFPLPACITTDPVRLKQILINVCSNAIKFTEQGGITLTLSFDKQNKSMIYKIRDTGIGMTAEQLDKIFDPFKQADSSITRRYGGTGLGLSLSRRLAELLGGTLSVSSTPDVGSEFVLAVSAGNLQDVPLLDSIEQLAQKSAATEDHPVKVGLQGTVLLAEDNDNNQRLFSLYLKKIGAEVTLASNGAEALTHARQQAFDLIFMDMQMPVMSGIDAVRQLRQEGYSNPIVALTANATKEDRRQCLEAGFDDFVTKPITRERLYQAAAQYLQQVTVPSMARIPLVSNLIDDDPEFIDIVILYVNRLPDMINKISTAYHQQEWTVFKKEVHSLKGTGGGVGYPQLTEVATEIEKFLLQQNFTAIENCLAELAELVVRIRAGMPVTPQGTAKPQTTPLAPDLSK